MNYGFHAIMSLWLTLLVPTGVPGVAVGSPSNSSPSSHTAVHANHAYDRSYPSAITEPLQKWSQLWNALFHDEDESGRQPSRNTTEEYRAIREAASDSAPETECPPPPKQLSKLNFNINDPMIAAALSLSTLAEMHARNFIGEPRDRHDYKLRACTRATKMLNRALRPFNRNETEFCRWNYTCDYQPNRFPQYIVQAVCQNSVCRACSTYPAAPFSPCLPVRATMEVLRWTCPQSLQEDSAAGSGDATAVPATGTVWIERVDPTLACRCKISSYSHYHSGGLV